MRNRQNDRGQWAERDNGGYGRGRNSQQQHRSGQQRQDRGGRPEFQAYGGNQTGWDQDFDRSPWEESFGGEDREMERRGDFEHTGGARDRGYGAEWDDRGSRYGLRNGDYGSGSQGRDEGSGWHDRDARDQERDSGYGARDRGYGSRGGGGWAQQGQSRAGSNDLGEQLGQRRYAKGPKGYKRSDERIKEDLSEKLHSRFDIDSSEVEIEVKNAEVTLTGTVPNRDMRFRLEQCADGILGVDDVTNNVKVKKETSSSGTSSAQDRSAPQGSSSSSRSTSSSR